MKQVEEEEEDGWTKGWKEEYKGRAEQIQQIEVGELSARTAVKAGKDSNTDRERTREREREPG